MLKLVAAAVRSADDHSTVGTEIAASEESGGGFFAWLFRTDGFHSPSIKEFFPEAILFEGTIFQFDRVTMIRIIVAVLIIAIFSLVAARATVVPGRGQAFIEVILDFVRYQIVEPVMGAKEARRFLPFLTTLFVAIVFFNVTGVLPFLNIAATSLIGLPLIMALWVYVMYLGVGIKKQGLGGYLKNNLFPAGVPWFVYPLLTPIEFLQVFILRPATLALRLAANMMAGHLLLVLCFAASHYFLLEADYVASWGYGAGTLVAGFAFTLFEIFVALLQAYVFVMLSAVYLNMALQEDH